MTVWTTGITYVWTLEGWLYLAAVLDLFSRQVVGWAMDKRVTRDLALDALSIAYWRRKPSPGLLHHSDKGNYWYNALTERFSRSLKSERLSYCRFVGR